MDKKAILTFFNQAASTWDAEMISSDSIIEKILDGAEMRPEKTVLDVACGTGIMIPHYLKRQARAVTGIDISPEMVRICARKFTGEPVDILCGDVEETPFDRQFDCVMVYNAFPHFPDPENLIRVLSGLVAPKGSLTIAHGMSREEINRRHAAKAHAVSRPLMAAEALAQLLEPYLTVTTIVSDDTMYQVTGKKL